MFYIRVLAVSLTEGTLVDASVDSMPSAAASHLTRYGYPPDIVIGAINL